MYILHIWCGPSVFLPYFAFRYHELKLAVQPTYISKYFCQGQFQVAILVGIELSHSYRNVEVDLADMWR